MQQGLGARPALGLVDCLDLADSRRARPSVEVLLLADVAGDRRGAVPYAPAAKAEPPDAQAFFCRLEILHPVLDITAERFPVALQRQG